MAHSTPVLLGYGSLREGTGPLDTIDQSNLETGRTRPARIVLGDPIPEMVMLLPEPAELGAVLHWRAVPGRAQAINVRRYSAAKSVSWPSA